MPIVEEDRFWSHVDKSAGPDGCWLWTASINKGGYGNFRASSPRRTVLAHRFAWVLVHGPIPEGLTIDHVRTRGCVHRHCVNPAHLEPVTMAVNVLRGDTITAAHAAKTHCPRGHPYNGSNLYVNPQGGRECRRCHRDREERRRHAYR